MGLTVEAENMDVKNANVSMNAILYVVLRRLASSAMGRKRMNEWDCSRKVSR